LNSAKPHVQESRVVIIHGRKQSPEFFDLLFGHAAHDAEELRPGDALDGLHKDAQSTRGKSAEVGQSEASFTQPIFN
jgi:hypothetical protein